MDRRESNSPALPRENVVFRGERERETKKKGGRKWGEESHEHALGYTSFQGPLSDRSKRRPSRFHSPFATSCTVTCSRYALYSSYTPATLPSPPGAFPSISTLFVLIPLRQPRDETPAPPPFLVAWSTTIKPHLGEIIRHNSLTLWGCVSPRAFAASVRAPITRIPLNHVLVLRDRREPGRTDPATRLFSSSRLS